MHSRRASIAFLPVHQQLVCHSLDSSTTLLLSPCWHMHGMPGYHARVWVRIGASDTCLGGLDRRARSLASAVVMFNDSVLSERQPLFWYTDLA